MIKHVFLDDGGVLNDNELRGPQWRRLVGEFFVPRLGGTPEAWSDANRTGFTTAIENMHSRLAGWRGPDFDYARVVSACDLEWLESMASTVGVEMPNSKPDRLALSEESGCYIRSRVHAAYPGVPEAVRALASRFNLYTASGGTRRELTDMLPGMGLEGVFLELYGPDLVNTPKAGPEFYERVFTNANVDPNEALVVDDKASALAWAREAGAYTGLIGPNAEGNIDFVAPSLPGLVESLLTRRSSP